MYQAPSTQEESKNGCTSQSSLSNVSDFQKSRHLQISIRLHSAILQSNSLSPYLFIRIPPHCIGWLLYLPPAYVTGIYIHQRSSSSLRWWKTSPNFFVFTRIWTLVSNVCTHGNKSILCKHSMRLLDLTSKSKIKHFSSIITLRGTSLDQNGS